MYAFTLTAPQGHYAAVDPDMVICDPGEPGDLRFQAVFVDRPAYGSVTVVTKTCVTRHPIHGHPVTCDLELAVIHVDSLGHPGEGTDSPVLVAFALPRWDRTRHYCFSGHDVLYDLDGNHVGTVVDADPADDE